MGGTPYAQRIHARSRQRPDLGHVGHTGGAHGGSGWAMSLGDEHDT